MRPDVLVTEQGLRTAATILRGTAEAVGPEWTEAEVAQLVAVADQLEVEAGRRSDARARRTRDAHDRRAAKLAQRRLASRRPQ